MISCRSMGEMGPRPTIPSELVTVANPIIITPVILLMAAITVVTAVGMGATVAEVEMAVAMGAAAVVAVEEVTPR